MTQLSVWKRKKDSHDIKENNKRDHQPSYAHPFLIS